MTALTGTRIAILATHGYEKSELFEPQRQLREAGAEVSVVSPESGSIRSWDKTDWGDVANVDVDLEAAEVGDFDCLVLPGGQINPDILRMNDTAVSFVRDFFNSKKVLAAICHAPWMLIEAAIVRERRVTSYASIRTDVENAGAHWEDSEVVVDRPLITSRAPGDLDAFCATIRQEIRAR